MTSFGEAYVTSFTINLNKPCRPLCQGPSLFPPAQRRTTDPLLPRALLRRDCNGCKFSPLVQPHLSIAPAAPQRFCTSKCRWRILPRAARRFVLPSLCSAVSCRRVAARPGAVPSAQRHHGAREVMLTGPAFLEGRISPILMSPNPSPSGSTKHVPRSGRDG